MSDGRNDSLELLLARLTRDASFLLAHEDATKQGVVLPILARLGWDRDNVQEVVPEHRVGSGRVDYCLKAGERSRVFLEVKRIDEGLTGHQEQLLDYAFREGVELAALTNGVLWWLYLPLLQGSWEQRKFFTIDIVEQGPRTAAEHFQSFLSRDEVGSGRAVQRARELHESHEKERLTSATLPKAWRLLCEGPDPLLVELISEKVESLCGHQPTPDQVARFLGGAERAQQTTEVSAAVLKPRPSRDPEPPARNGRAHGFTFSRPTGFTLFGSRHRASSWKEVLVGVCELLASRHGKDFERVLQLGGRTRRYFGREYREMNAPAEIRGTDIWAETNLSANGIVKRCGQVLQLLGHGQESLEVHVQ